MRHTLPDGEVWQGHVLDSLATLPAESVQMCVTSPPYYGLRKYAGEQTTQWSDGQWAYGLEDSPARWAEHTLKWLRAVRRVLRRDGTVWLNVGSSYASGGMSNPSSSSTLEGGKDLGAGEYTIARPVPLGYKPLDLIDPFALLYPGLLADGWYVRSVVIWAKPNPMPESVAGWRWERCRVRTAPSKAPEQGHRVGVDIDEWVGGTMDNGNHRAEWADCPGCAKCAPNDGLVLRRGSWRPTSSYEYVIMLAKTASYYSDGEGVREPLLASTLERGYTAAYMDGLESGKSATLEREVRAKNDWRANPYIPSGRNLRDVWELPTQPYSGAHFATYPEELVKRCILSSTPDAGVCAVCGSPWARVIERQGGEITERPKALLARDTGNGTNGTAGSTLGIGGGGHGEAWLENGTKTNTLGWRPTCAHSEAQPATILDPFGGSGTSAVVARSLGRRFVLCELSESYVQMALWRLAGTQPAMVMA